MGTVGQAALAVAWLLVVIFLPDGLGGVLVRGATGSTTRSRAGTASTRCASGTASRRAAHASSPLHQTPRLEGLFDARRPRGSRRAGPILTVSGMSRRFGGVVAVDHVDFEVAPGEILGIIGPNGAGKTTCFEIVAGFTTPDAGRSSSRASTSPARLRSSAPARAWCGRSRTPRCSRR